MDVRGELKNASLETLTSDPVSVKQAQIFYNNTDKTLNCFTDTDLIKVYSKKVPIYSSEISFSQTSMVSGSSYLVTGLTGSINCVEARPIQIEWIHGGTNSYQFLQYCNVGGATSITSSLDIYRNGTKIMSEKILNYDVSTSTLDTSYGYKLNTLDVNTIAGSAYTYTFKLLTTISGGAPTVNMFLTNCKLVLREI